MCGLSEAEVCAIAEHEHVPVEVATGLAQTLLKQAHGTEKVRHMIVDDIRAAHERGDERHVHELLICLRNFLNEHPQAIPDAGARRA